MDYNKIFTVISIWYVFWFLLSIIMSWFNIDKPQMKIFGLDLIGNNIFTFIPAFIYILWVYILKY